MATSELLPIPDGRLQLRDARTSTVREVDLDPFELARTPVTDADGVPRHPVTWFDAIRACNVASAAAGLATAYEVDDRVVTWHTDADGFRLPTEAEWEWACRAGSVTPTYGPLDRIAWTAADAVEDAQPVAGKEPNAFGLFDMLGNVWEWCWDYADPARYADYRVLRGGGWADEAWSVRASVRRGSAPDAVLEDVGFRIARGAAPTDTREFQGWSASTDRARADIRGPLPSGWTPLRS